jgi:hypothetical protein
MTCVTNSTFLSCSNSDLSVNLSAIGNPVSYYSLSYSYINGSYSMSINYSNKEYFITLIKNPGGINFSVYNNTFLSITNNNNGVLLLVKLNKTEAPLSIFERLSIQPVATVATNIFELYSVPLVLLFLVIIANLSGFPLTYKAGVVALGSFLAGLLFQNPLFYFISFVSIVALGLLKFGGR